MFRLYLFIITLLNSITFKYFLSFITSTYRLIALAQGGSLLDSKTRMLPESLSALAQAVHVLQLLEQTYIHGLRYVDDATFYSKPAGVLFSKKSQ